MFLKSLGNIMIEVNLNYLALKCKRCIKTNTMTENCKKKKKCRTRFSPLKLLETNFVQGKHCLKSSQMYALCTKIWSVVMILFIIGKRTRFYYWYAFTTFQRRNNIISRIFVQRILFCNTWSFFFNTTTLYFITTRRYTCIYFYIFH